MGHIVIYYFNGNLLLDSMDTSPVSITDNGEHCHLEIRRYNRIYLITLGSLNYVQRWTT
jgi:hypothetical protein